MEYWTKIAGYFFYSFDDHVYWTYWRPWHITVCIELGYTDHGFATSNRRQTGLLKAKKRVLGIRILYIIQIEGDDEEQRDWRISLPQNTNSVTRQRLSADLPIKLSASVVTRLNPD